MHSEYTFFFSEGHCNESSAKHLFEQDEVRGVVRFALPHVTTSLHDSSKWLSVLNHKTSKTASQRHNGLENKKARLILYHVLHLYWAPSKAYLMTGLWRSIWALSYDHAQRPISQWMYLGMRFIRQFGNSPLKLSEHIQASSVDRSPTFLAL